LVCNIFYNIYIYILFFVAVTKLRFANLNAEHAAKSVRRSAFDNFTQPEDVQHERCLVKVGKHPCFERVAMAATLLNAIWIPIDIEFNAEPASDASQGFFVVENIFLLFFSVELLLRFIGYSSGCNAIRDPPFIFDAVLVTGWWFQSYVCFIEMGG